MNTLALSRASIMTKIQLTNWRWSWPQMLLTGLSVPVLVGIGLGVYAAKSGPNNVSYAVIGGLVFSLLFELQGKLASNISFMKEKGALDLLAATGSTRWEYVSGTFLAFWLLALPAILITPVAVWLAVGASPSLNIILLPGLLVISVLFMGLGLVIGAMSSSLEQASSLSAFVSIILMAAGPVAIPPILLPDWINLVGWLNPAVHASAVMRAGLLGGDLKSGWVSLAVLALCTILVLVFVGRSLPWRFQR